jgi:hypothetical protein
VWGRPSESPTSVPKSPAGVVTPAPWSEIRNIRCDQSNLAKIHGDAKRHAMFRFGGPSHPWLPGPSIPPDCWSSTSSGLADDRLCEKAQADGLALDFVLYDLRQHLCDPHGRGGDRPGDTRENPRPQLGSASWNATFTRRTSTRKAQWSATRRVRWCWPNKLDRTRGPIEANL